MLIKQVLELLMQKLIMRFPLQSKQISIGAEINDHKFRGMKQQNCIILKFQGQKSSMGIAGLKSVLGGLHLWLEALGKNFFAWLLQLLEATHILWLVMSSSIFKASLSDPGLSQQNFF